MRVIRELVRVAVALVRAVWIGLVHPQRLANWGAVSLEDSSHFAGDDVLHDADVRWLRAIRIDAPASAVWPWVSQLGRGAGYYSFDALDNGRRPSASHLLDLPAPAVGDRNEAIGEVVAVDIGHEIVWRTGPVRFLGATGQMALSYSIIPDGEGCRVVTLVLATISGRTARLARAVFALMDYVMAPEQLRGLKHRAEGTPLTSNTTSHHSCQDPGAHQRDAVVFAGSRRLASMN